MSVYLEVNPTVFNGSYTQVSVLLENAVRMELLWQESKITFIAVEKLANKT